MRIYLSPTQCFVSGYDADIAIDVHSTKWNITRESDFIVPDGRPFGTAMLFQFDEAVVSEFVDVFGDFRWRPVDEQGEFTVRCLRDDVGDQYAAGDIDKVIDDSRLESLAAPIYTDIFSEDHSELTCLVKCFENVLEMNFVITDGVGTTVALDSGAFGDTHRLVADAREIAIQERREASGTTTLTEMVRLITNTNSEHEYAAVCIRETGLYLCYDDEPTEASTPGTIFTANSVEQVQPDETVDEVSRLIDVEGETGIPVDKLKHMRDSRVVVDCWVR